MKRISFIIFTLLIIANTFAQSISISSFKLLDTDLTANTAGTMEIDQNGETAALIKVVTTQTGFTFDGGVMGIVKTKQTPGEVWVYIPKGSKKISIKHQQLGVLRDYFFPIAIEAARTYEMTLITGEIQTTVKKARTSQYIVFQMTPPNAVAELDGELLETTDGTATKMKKFGTYNYRIQAPNYLSEAGSITINDPTNKHIVNINLKPNYSVVTLSVDNGAEIWVNGEKKGVGSWRGNLGAGTYEFETRKQNHKSISVTRDIIVTSESQTIRLQAPTPILGEADINSTPAMADIYIDDTKVGQTPMLVENIIIGNHTIKLSKIGYKDKNLTISVKENKLESVSAILEKSSSNTQDYTSAMNNEKFLEFKFGNDSFKMIYVEGGEFFLGPENNNNRIKIPSYYIGETEVTQALWYAVTGMNPSFHKGNNKPVDCVSWEDCQYFIDRLNKLSDKKFRLPTEAEWEFAAKGGNLSKGYSFSGSENLDLVSWYDKSSSSTTHYVKNKKPNELGIYDMSGNVWEWCQDWYSSYFDGSRSSLYGPSYGDKKVYRGGSFNLSAEYQQVTRRNSASPKYRIETIGLRLALSAD